MATRSQETIEVEAHFESVANHFILLLLYTDVSKQEAIQNWLSDTSIAFFFCFAEPVQGSCCEEQQL